jgi:hypothetical protein
MTSLLDCSTGSDGWKSKMSGKHFLISNDHSNRILYHSVPLSPFSVSSTVHGNAENQDRTGRAGSSRRAGCYKTIRVRIPNSTLSLTFPPSLVFSLAHPTHH